MYFGYARVSTPTQATKGIGLDVQISQIKSYAESHGYALQEIFSDSGVSGTKETREGIEKLFAALDKGDFVIVQNTNRLWRDIFAEATILKTLMNIGADIISIDEPDINIEKILKDPEGALMFGVMSAIAAYQRLEINRKLGRARTTKAKAGDKPAGRVPYGYKYADDRKSIEVNQDESVIVRQIFSLAQMGNSTSKIAKTLNEKGLRTRSGNPWAKSSIRFILQNRFYLGIVLHQGREIPGNHTPLVSKVQFGKCQSQLKKHHR